MGLRYLNLSNCLAGPVLPFSYVSSILLHTKFVAHVVFTQKIVSSMKSKFCKLFFLDLAHKEYSMSIY